MFVYLSKKITIPNGVKLRSIAWNTEQGWIACGGENGLLKVIRLDHGQGTAGTRIFGGTNLSTTQNLEGHDKAISVVTWNDHAERLTSSDEDGLIIVWKLHRGMWFEDMVNNRNRSVVRDLAWNAEGQKVCIVYEDGAIIVGSVEGSRLWGKEIKKQLAKVTWSPDGRYILFGTATGEILVHDSTTGQYLSKVPVQCVDEGEYKLAGLVWHPGSSEHCGEEVAALAIGYECGKIQLMRNDHDEQPHLIDTGLTIFTMKWNPTGTVLALAGVAATGNDRAHILVQFFDCNGQHLRTLPVPGTTCGGLTWEGSGLRIALAVDSFIYFANVRPKYKYTFFSNTAVYSFTKSERDDRSLMFWNLKTHEKNVKHVRLLKGITSYGDTCAVVSQLESGNTQHQVALNNAIGSPLDVKIVDFEPTMVLMNELTVVLLSTEYIHVWQFRSPTVVVDALDPVSIAAARKETAEKIFHADDMVGPDSIAPTNVRKIGITNDLICAACVSEDLLFVARESNVLQIYTLNPVKLVAKETLADRAQMMKVNCDGTAIAVIDIRGVLKLYNIYKENFTTVVHQCDRIDFERKDVWDIEFARDNPEMFAIMEKTRMYVFRGLDPEEPVLTSAHLCRFDALTIRSVNVDEIMLSPEAPPKEYAVEFETKSLRDTRELLKTVGLKDAQTYIEGHPHPVLWGLLAESALEQLEFPVAEKAVVQCREYPAIQFVKRIKALDDSMKQRAEVFAYYHRFDDAEKLYKEMDRKDLAVEMRARLGDWFRVVQLVQEGGGDEALIHNAWENIGDYYSDRQKWTKAVQYYTQCRAYEKLARVYYTLEDFRGMEKLLEQAGHNKELCEWLGDQFMTVGLAESAVAAYLKAGAVRRAVDCCMELHYWQQAVKLADDHNIQDIGHCLSKYATHLVENHRVPQAIELYRKAGHNNEAAKLLSKLGQQAAAQRNPLKAKKFYVLAALEIEAFRRRQLDLTAKTAAKAAEELLQADEATVGDKSLDSAWRGAEAYHFFMLSQSLLYGNNVDAALNVGMRLMDYDDVISTKDAYSLIALCAYYAKNYGLCSKAFTRLEAIEEMEEAEDPFSTGSGGGSGGGASGGAAGGAQDMTLQALLDRDNAIDLTQTGGGVGAGAATLGFANAAPLMSERPRKYGALAVTIFTRNQPTDSSMDKIRCFQCNAKSREWASQCQECATPFAACLITGRALPSMGDGEWQCQQCRHHALSAEISKVRHCPLCHFPI